MQRLYTLLFVLLCSHQIILAQTNAVKELQQSLSAASSNEETTIHILNDISDNLYRDYSRDILQACLPIYNNAIKSNKKKLIVFSNICIGRCYSNLRKSDSAAFYFRKGIEIAAVSNYDEAVGILFHNHGYNFYTNNILDSAFIYFNKAIEKKEVLPQKRPLAITYNALGLLQRTRGKWELAKTYYNKALQIFEKEDPKSSLSTLSNIATIYNLEKKYDSATIIFKEIIQKAETYKDATTILSAKINMALALNFQEKYSEALPTFEELANNAVVKKIEDLNNAIQYGFGQAYAGLGNCDKAIPILKNCLNLRYKNTKYQSLAAITHLLYKCEKEKGNYEAALNYYVQLKNYSDSLSNAKNLENLNELTTKYETERKEKEISLLNKDNQLKQLQITQQTHLLLLEQAKSNQNQQRILLLNKDNELKSLVLAKSQQQLLISRAKNIETIHKVELLNKQNRLTQIELKEKKKTSWLYTLGFIVLSLLAFGAFLLYYQNKKNNAILASKNTIITKSLEDKEVLLKEIHHRVKNNLQVVSSLLNLQTRNISDTNALAALKEGRDRVKSMALLHQNLYQDDNLRGVDVKNYLEVLTQSLFTSYNISKEKVALKTSIDTLNLDIETVLPIGLIMNELISNCLKYAFDDTQNGILEIILKKNDAAIVLSVKDNGKGLPENFNPDKLSSLGYQLIKSFVQKLKGELKFINAGGTHVEILISNYTLTS